ncbi:MAG: SecD/SecF fusion protein, partial [Verrucomicrobiota bacterium]
MNRNNLGRFLLVIFIVVWSLYEIYPPKARDLVEYFRNRGVSRDATFTGIVEQAKKLQQVQSDRAFANLQEAIGTNDITRYFPFFEAKTQAKPTIFILNRLQREAAGKIRLGIDLQGGTSFLVEMDTNRLDSTQSASTALTEAVEVLRKRVDRFGVAEPVIQPEGDNHILIQLPGLSEADMALAKETIQKAAFLEFKLVHEDSKNLIAQG